MENMVLANRLTEMAQTVLNMDRFTEDLSKITINRDLYYQFRVLANVILRNWAIALIGEASGGATWSRIAAMLKLRNTLTTNQLRNLRVVEYSEEKTGCRYDMVACSKGFAIKIGSGGWHGSSRKSAYQIWAIWN
jgi:hypothetical protein